MTEDERRALGATRRLVFQNLANGVPAAHVRESLRLSDLEIEQARVRQPENHRIPDAAPTAAHSLPDDG
jgi:hypothetical protein